MNRYEKVQRGKEILNQYEKIPCHRHQWWWLIDRRLFCERVAMMVRGAIMFTQQSDIGGSTGDDKGLVRNEEEEK